MRKLIVANITSLDGFYEGPQGNVMALPMDAAFDQFNLEHIRAAGTVLLGGRSYTMFSSFWPAVAEDEAASSTNRAFSRIYNTINKIAVSDTLDPCQTGPWADTTTVVRTADSHDAIAALKAGTGDDIVVFGSHILWNSLLDAGLVDEIHLVIGAAPLGDGTPLFVTPSTRALRPIDVRIGEGSTNLLAHYAVD